MPQNSLKIQFDKTPTKSRAQTRNAELQPRGPFLESPGNFTRPKSKIQIEI